MSDPFTDPHPAETHIETTDEAFDELIHPTGEDAVDEDALDGELTPEQVELDQG